MDWMPAMAAPRSKQQLPGGRRHPATLLGLVPGLILGPAILGPAIFDPVLGPAFGPVFGQAAEAAELPSARGGDGAGRPYDPYTTLGGARGQSGAMGQPTVFCDNWYRGGGGGGANAAGGAGRDCGSPGAAGGQPGNMAVDQGHGGDGGVGGLHGSQDFRAAGGGGGGATCFVGAATACDGARSCTGGAGGNGGSGRSWLAAGAGGGGGDGAELHGDGATALSWSGQLVGGDGGRPGTWPLHTLIVPDGSLFAGSGAGGAGLFLTGPIDAASFSGTARGGAGGAPSAPAFGGSNGNPGSPGVTGCSNGGAGNPATSQFDIMPSRGAAGGSGIELAADAGLTQDGVATGGAGGAALAAPGGFRGGDGGRGGNGWDGEPPGNGCSGGPAGAGSRGADGASSGAGGAGVVLVPDTALINRRTIAGGAGGAGSEGGPGGPGGTGGAGGDGGYGTTVGGYPTRGNGGDGHHGGSGGPGGHGGHGGAGGAGIVMLGGASLRNEFAVGTADGRIEGGAGGAGGAPGAGGSGGAGGVGGGSTLPGVPGGNAGPGLAGAPGFNGLPGPGGAGLVAGVGDDIDNLRAAILGGAGGNAAGGGSGLVLGSGGAGGDGALLDGARLLSTRGAILGGNGGAAGTSGGTGYPTGGRGGMGGAGVRAAGGAQLTIAGSAGFVHAIAGGNGAPGVDSAGGGAREGGAGGTGALLASDSVLTIAADGAVHASIGGGKGGRGGNVFDVVVQDRGGNGGQGGDGVRMQPGALLIDSGGTDVFGGSGGAGGSGGWFTAAGRGADGGVALRIDGAASASVHATSSYKGGSGGAGGACGSTGPRAQSGSQAGAGGAAVVVADATLEFAGAAIGGAGGQGAASPDPCWNAPVHGTGGAALVLQGEATVVLSGSAIGGLRGGSSAESDRAPAVLLRGGGNLLELRGGFALTGRAQSESALLGGGDVLVLGGAGLVDSFDLATLGDTAQFRGFQQLRKTGAGVWRLSGSSPFSGPTRIEQGVLDVRGNLAGSAVSVAGGALAGSGHTGAVDNAARVSPGAFAFGMSTDTLRVAAYAQQAAAVLAMEAGAPATYDRLEVAGTAQLAGTLEVLFFHVPVVGESYALLSAGSLAGAFDALSVVQTSGQPLPPAMLDYGATTAGTVTLSFFDIALSTSPGAATFKQAPAGVAAAVRVDPDLALSGSVAPERATVALVGNIYPDQDRLAFVNDDAMQYGNIAASYDAPGGTLALQSAGGTATLAQWQAALRVVTYENITQMPVLLAAGTRAVRFQVTRGAFTTPVRLREVVVADARAAQALDFGAQSPAQRAFVSGGRFELAPPALASSGLAPAYDAAPAQVCSISGTTVTMLGPGECVVTATQAGDAAFAPAPPALQSVLLFSDRVEAGSLPPLEDAEGHGGTRRLALPLLLDAARTDAVTLSYAVVARDAFGSPAQDFVAPTGSVTFPPGVIEVVLDLDVVADGMVEPDERFLLSLMPLPADATGEANATLGTTLAAGLELAIANDDTAVLALSAPAALEGAEALVFDWSLDAPVQGGMEIAFATMEGSAQAGVDFQPLSGEFTHDGTAGTSIHRVEVGLVDDLLHEADEELVLAATVDCAFACGGAMDVIDDVGVVLDDDAAGLSIGIDNGTDSSDPHTVVSYGIVAMNHGADAATGVGVSMALPAGAELLDWNCEASAPGQCTPAGGFDGELSTNVDLAAGAAVQIRAQVLLGDFVHHVSVSTSLTVPSGHDDPGSTDNTATDTDLKRTLFADSFE